MDEILLNKISEKIQDLSKEVSQNKHPNFSASNAVELYAKITVLKELQEEILSLVI